MTRIKLSSVFNKLIFESIIDSRTVNDVSRKKWSM